MASPARIAGVGAFVIAGVLLFAVGLFMIGDRQMAFARKFTVYTEFSRITGLQPGAIIRVSGAKAGTVKDIQVPKTASGKFRVQLEIVEELHPLVRTDSIASIETEGLVGGSYLAVSTGTDSAPRAPENGTLPSREPFEIADLIQQMSQTVAKVNDTIDLLKDDVLHAVQSVGDTVDNANALIDDVSGDVKTMAASGARISASVAEISDDIRGGKGTFGKLVTDDELYRHATQVAKNAQDISENARQVVEQARQTLAGLQDQNGPVQGMTSNVKQTLDDARAAMSGFAEDMEALKHNFLLRGYFKSRGYFNLADVSPAEYRAGKLTRDSDRRVVRVWLRAPMLFEAVAGQTGTEQLSDAGRQRLDSAIAPYLPHLAAAVLVVEGYAAGGTSDELFVRSRARAALVREYLIGKFHLDPSATGLMPLGSEATGSPDGSQWDGIALAVFVEKGTLAQEK